MYNPFSSNVYRSVERDLGGNWFYEFMNGGTAGKYGSDLERFNTVLYNPAVLKAIKLQCDMFSLGKFKAVRNGKELPNDQLIKLLKYPNLFQSQRQFLWDHMFWLMVFGNSYLHNTSSILNDKTKLYFLNPSNLVWTDKLIKQLDKIVLSEKSFKDIKDLQIEYKQKDGTSKYYKLKEIAPFFDLSNGLGNWYRGASPLDALYKIIDNVEIGLDSKGTSLKFAGKYLVSGQHKESDVYGTPMGETEKNSIEQSTMSNKPVHAVKSMLDIKRFVEDIDKLKLDDAYISDFFKVCNFYGIPRDVAEASVQGSTYENQEKSRGAHVEYCLQPKGNDLADGLERLFGYTDKNIDIQISWSHLGFMQFFEKERVNVVTTRLNNLRIAQEMELLTPEEVIERGKMILDE